MLKIRNNTDQHKVIRAVHPNEGVTAWFHTELVSLLQDAMRDAVMIVGEAYTEAPDVGIAMDAPPTITKVDRALKRWGDKWRGKFDKLSVTVAKKFASRSFTSTDTALKSALRDAGFTVSFKPTRKSLESYKLVVADNVGLIRNLQASFYNKIQQDTWASVRAGHDMATLSTKLHQSYGIEANRAALIARDQNAKAKAVLETTRRQELGIRQAIWQHSSAGREPRPLHQQWGREGAVFDLDKGMFDTDENEYVFPGQLINCRCSSRAIIPGLTDDEN